jgi:hypothetical protein
MSRKVLENEVDTIRAIVARMATAISTSGSVKPRSREE